MTNFNGSTGNDVFVGGDGNDTAVGNAGSDSLSGAGGDDLLIGGAGPDTLNGGDGDDKLYSGDEFPPFNLPYYNSTWSPPLLDTGAESDTLVGGEGSDRLFAGYGDNVDGGGGGGSGDYLYISFMGASAGVTADFRQVTQVIGGGTITGVENISWVQGSDFGDDINVGSYSNSGYSDFTAVFGMGGNDHLVAGYYTGVIDGGDGNDIVDGRNSQYLQNIYGGAGNDTLYTATNTLAAAYGGDGDDTIYSHGLTYGGAGNDVIIIQLSYYPGGVFGEAGDDQIQASSAGSIISGGTGADIINGDAGADTLISGDRITTDTVPSPDMGLEHDVLNGFGGNDILSSGYGDDVDGGSGSDTLYLSLGGLTAGITFSTAGIVSGQPFVLGSGVIANVETLAYLRGSEFDDVLTIVSQTAQLTVDAGAGDDVIISSGALVSISGGAGNDRFVSSSAGESFDGGLGIDTADYGASGVGVTVSLATGLGPNSDHLMNVENVDGSAQNDALTGNGNVNVLRGMAGDDVLDGLGGADTLIGGLGDDTYYVDNTADVVIEAASEGLDTVLSSTTYTLSAEVENLTLTGFTSVNGTGNAGANRITGNAGVNVLSGGDGNDTLVGGDGDTLIGGAGADTLDGTGGNVTASYLGSSAAITADLSQQTVTGGDATGDILLSIENLFGTSFNDFILGSSDANILSGDAGDDSINGGGGDDTLDGGSGADTMTGGTGNDTYVVDSAQDQVVEIAGEGADRINVSTTAGLTAYVLAPSLSIEVLAAANPSATTALDLTGNEFGQQLFGNAGNNVLAGGGGDDTLYGYGGADSLNGGTGADTMYGGAGSDIYVVDNAGDTIVELAGEGIDAVTVYVSTYILPANVEKMGFANVGTLATGNALDNEMHAGSTGAILRGLGGADFLAGSVGADTLEGGDGGDTLTGGAAADTLTGGAGVDLFKDSTAGLNGDTITDLSVGEKIQITDASLGGFSFSLTGSTLTYTGGSLTLANLPGGYHLEASAAAQGVALTLVKDPVRILDNGLSGDFNGDGRSDLLWRSDAGQMSNWLGQANGGYANNDANAFVSVSTDWHVVGAGDFNGDGRDDIVWRSDSGQMSDWLGTASGGWAGNDANAFTTVSTDWKIIGVGDFNGDGKSDLLWRSDAGQMSNWLGQANGGFVGNDANAFVNVSTDWHVVGVGDFNGDKISDILWRSDAGQLSDWLGTASGGFVGNDTNAFTTVSTAWHVVGVGDFNGDKISDILWRSDSGQMSNWLGKANGGFTGNDANAFVSVSTDWTVAGVGDFNGDGRDDIVWRSASGAMSNWLGQANGGFSGNDANAMAQVDTHWHIQVDNLFGV